MSNAINHQVNRLRLSLWDVFSFFLTGILFGIIVLIGFILFVEIAIVDIAQTLVSLPTAIIIFVIPLLATLVGLLIEPIASYFDRYVLTPVIGLFLENPRRGIFKLVLSKRKYATTILAL